MTLPTKKIGKYSGVPIALGSIMAILGISASVMIYQKTREITIAWGGDGEFSFPSSKVDEKASTRPDYYKGERRHAHISILQIPIVVGGGVDGVSSINVEFVLEASNRYLKKYLENRELWVRDRLLSSLEPLSPLFMLTIEGKDVVKWKILDELNRLVEEKGVEGQIEEVSIKSIIAT